MTTDLATTTTQETALSEMQSAILAEMKSPAERHAFDFIPTRIRMPSGGLQVFTTSDGAVLPPFTGVIAVAQSARAYWPGKDTMGLPPVCSSPDTVTGWLADAIEESQLKDALRALVKHPALTNLEGHRGPFDCNACPLSGWGTASSTSRGQACKLLRRLLVLVDGWAMPAVLTLPPTSVKVLDLFASARASRGHLAYFSCRTRFELEQKRNPQGVTFSVVKLTALGELEDGELATVLAIRARYADLVRELSIEAVEYETVTPADVPF